MGHLQRIQDRQSAAQIRVSGVCQEVQSLSYEARRLRHLAFVEAVHGTTQACQTISAAFLGSSASSDLQPHQHPQPRQPQLESHSGIF